MASCCFWIVVASFVPLFSSEGSFRHAGQRRFVLSSFSGVRSVGGQCVFWPRTVSAESFNWQSVSGQNWKSPVRSQFGGTCWDFSACGTLEANYMLTRNDSSYNADVSEQQLVWETNPDMGSTGGGWGTAVIGLFHLARRRLGNGMPASDIQRERGHPPYWPLAAGWENRVSRNSVSNSERLSRTTQHQ